MPIPSLYLHSACGHGRQHDMSPWEVVMFSQYRPSTTSRNQHLHSSSRGRIIAYTRLSWERDSPAETGSDRARSWPGSSYCEPRERILDGLPWSLDVSKRIEEWHILLRTGNCVWVLRVLARKARQQRNCNVNYRQQGHSCGEHEDGAKKSDIIVRTWKGPRSGPDCAQNTRASSGRRESLADWGWAQGFAILRPS